MYFLQYGHPPSFLIDGQHEKNTILNSCPTPSSSCSDREIQGLVERQHLLEGRQRWEQQTGFDTFDIADDTFRLIPDHLPGGISEMINESNEQYSDHASAAWPQRAWRALLLRLPSQLPGNNVILLVCII